MATGSVRVPHAVAALAMPAALALLMPVYAVPLAATGGGRADLPHAMTVTLALFALYAAGCIAWLCLRRCVARDIALAMAGATFMLALTVTLFSFGYRATGAWVLVASVGALVVSLPRDAWGAQIVLRAPPRATLLYWTATLELPALLALALAARSYLGGADSASVTFGTALFLYLTYLLGFIGWSAVRAYSAVWALFSAVFFATFGLPSVMFLASLGPVSLVVPIAAVGGVIATLPYLWDRSQDEASAAPGVGA